MGSSDIIKPLSTVLSSAANKSLKIKILGSAEIWTHDHWVKKRERYPLCYLDPHYYWTLPSLCHLGAIFLSATETHIYYLLVYLSQVHEWDLLSSNQLRFAPKWIPSNAGCPAREHLSISNNNKRHGSDETQGKTDSSPTFGFRNTVCPFDFTRHCPVRANWIRCLNQPR